MIKLRRLTNPSELKMGMTILSVDFDDNEMLETIDCIDGDRIATASMLDPEDGAFETDYDGEPLTLQGYLDEYQAVYAVEDDGK